MQDLMELFEMASLNDGALSSGEKAAILEARRTLRLFEQAMEAFKKSLAGTPSGAETGFRMAA